MAFLDELKDMKENLSKLESDLFAIKSDSYARHIHERRPMLNEAAEISKTSQPRRIRNASAYGGGDVCADINLITLWPSEEALKWQDSFKYLYGLPFDLHTKITHHRPVDICNLRGNLMILNPGAYQSKIRDCDNLLERWALDGYSEGFWEQSFVIAIWRQLMVWSQRRSMGKEKGS